MGALLFFTGPTCITASSSSYTKPFDHPFRAATGRERYQHGTGPRNSAKDQLAAGFKSGSSWEAASADEAHERFLRHAGKIKDPKYSTALM
jgi:hypothetical protein